MVFLCVELLLAGPARSPAPDTLWLLVTNSGPCYPYLAYCFDPVSQPGNGPRAARLWQLSRFRQLTRFRPVPAGRVFQGGFT